MNDNDPKPKRDASSPDAQARSKRLTSPAMEQEQRRQSVQREAKRTGAGSNDPKEIVNQDG